MPRKIEDPKRTVSPLETNSHAGSDSNAPERQHDHTVRAPVRAREAVAPAPSAGPQPSAPSPEHPNETDDSAAFLKEIGTTDPNFGKGLLGDLLSTRTGDTESDVRRVLFTLAVVKGLKPRDELESMHLIQMAAVHAALMSLVAQLAQTDHPAIRDSLTRGITQLARAYTAQFDAFKRHRNGGEKQFTIQNVSVAEGGQAIVGNVTQATPEHEVAQATPALTDARQAPMEIIGEPERKPVRLRRAKSKP
jgi:hypothetical protein